MKSEILSHLPAGHPWREKIHWFDSIDSTNTLGKRMVLDGASHGTVLIAGHQTGGRGRLGRSFQSPEGMGVYMSILLRFSCPPKDLMHLTCAAAVAACDAVETAAGIRPGIKWTNDLVCGGRKIAGILTELVNTQDSVCAVVGIGVNCCQQAENFPEEIRDMAGSLTMVTGRSTDRAAVAAALIEAFERMDYGLLTDKEKMLESYRADCITLGREISVVRADDIRHGRAVGINDDGALLVRFSDGRTEAVQSGEVSIRGMYGYI